MRALRKYREVLLVTIQSSLAYPLEAFSRAGFMAIVIFVFIQLWRFMFHVSPNASFAGYDLSRMIWYLVLTETIAMSSPRTFDKIDQEVKSGDLTYTLSRPYSYPLFHFAQYMGNVLLVLPVNFAVGAVLALSLAGPSHLSLAGWPVVALAALLAICLNFTVELTIGLLAFWFEDTYAFFWIYQKFNFTLGGLFLPLVLFPSGLRIIASKLPFSSIAYGPARLTAGFDAGLVFSTIGTQLFWLVLLGGVAALVYRGGISRLHINGG